MRPLNKFINKLFAKKKAENEKKEMKETMIRTFRLGYVALKVHDVMKVSEHYENTLGLTLVEEGDQGERYLSTGMDHHNIILTKSTESELDAVGWQIAETDSLQNIAKYLKEQGFDAEIKTDAQPGIKELIELTDPSGHTVHLFQKIEMPGPGYKLDKVAPFKLGHLALGSLNKEKAVAFYKEILGFHETDKIGEKATFLTCNRDHHTLNVSNFGYKMLHHIAFELKDASHHTVACDVLHAHKVPVVWGPFRHTAGHNIASYHHDPELNLIELYTEMDQYIADLGIFEPRPYHEELPLRPRVWDGNCTWYPKVEYDIIDSVMKKVEKYMKK